MHAVTVRRTILTISAASLLAVLAAAGPAVAASPSPGNDPSTGSVGTRLATQNVELVPRLRAAGATTSPDGRFLVMPSGAQVSLVPAALSDCPSGSLCLWSDASYSGRLVRFTTPGSRTNLADVAFDNVMTSWANKTSVDARWFYDASLGGTTRCMNPGSSLANVGSTDNDKASSVAVYTDGAACT